MPGGSGRTALLRSCVFVCALFVFVFSTFSCCGCGAAAAAAAAGGREKSVRVLRTHQQFTSIQTSLPTAHRHCILGTFMSKNALSELLQRAKREKQAAQAIAPPDAVPVCLFDKCTPCSAHHAASHGCVYIPDFLDATDAGNFVAHIEASAQSWGGWARLHHRSLLNLGGVPHPSGTIAERLPPTLHTLCRRVCQSGALPFVPDQCLLNRCGQLPMSLLM